MSFHEQGLDEHQETNCLLYLQNEHRFAAISSGEDLGPLSCRRAVGDYWHMKPLDKRIIQCLIKIGFYGIYSIGHIQLDHSLITALVERWRQETHTFHLPIGECTITLQDVALLLGLPVDGDPVISSDISRDRTAWQSLCMELLGFTPSFTDFDGNRLKLKCLHDSFKNEPPDADVDDQTILLLARRHILLLIGGLLFPDKSGGMVKLMYLVLLRDLDVAGKYSWGSAVLACLYREMCRATRREVTEIGGPLILLQLWAWERLVHMRPERVLPRKQQPQPVLDESVDGGSVTSQPTAAHMEGVVVDQVLLGKPLGSRWRSKFALKKVTMHNLLVYRDQLDRLKDDEFIWQPYTPEIIGELPAYCLVGQEMWRTRSPLICFDMVEWHLPDRVMRQFGLKQMIPASCNTDTKLHKIDGRKRHSCNFQDLHAHFISLWAERHQFVSHGEPFVGSLTYNDPYLQWFRKNSFLLIGNPDYKPDVGFVGAGGMVELLTRVMKTLYDEANDAIEKFDGPSGLQTLQCIQDKLSAATEAIEQYYRPSEPELPAQKAIPMSSPTVVPKSSRKRSSAAAASNLPAQAPSKPSLEKSYGMQSRRSRGKKNRSQPTSPSS